MLKIKKSESGQAIVLLVFAIIGVMAFAGLAVDGGRLFVERRNVQNAADNASLGAALAICNDETNIVTTGLTIAAQNGYNNDGVFNTVTVNHPPTSGTFSGDDDYVEVIIDTDVAKTFIGIVYDGAMTAAGRSVSFCSITGGGIAEGYPPEPYAAYGGDPNCGESPIFVSGNANELLGPVHSNGNWKLSGNANTFGDSTYAGSAEQIESPNWFASGPSDNDTEHEWPLSNPAFDIDNYKPGGLYAAAAAAQGKYFYSNDKHEWSSANQWIPDGIYYAENEINMSGNNLGCYACTFVVGSTDGKVNFSGQGSNSKWFHPYVNNILVFAQGKGCTDDAINYNGNRHSWGGIVYSPYGQAQFSGNAGMAIEGCVWAAQVKFNGNSVEIADCDKWVDMSVTRTIDLIE